jgi:hypothetical protein
MRYYTDFDITGNSEEIQQRIKEVSGYNYFNGIKWYSSDKDMKQISLEFPDVILTLDGVGDKEALDIWKAYYKNGKGFTAKAKIVFEEYDESKLV